MRNLEEVSNEIVEKQKALKIEQSNQYLIEDRILQIQKDILVLQSAKKEKEIVASKGKHNIKQLILDIRMLTAEFWNLKN